MRKKTYREFEKLYGNLTSWPIEMMYQMYSDLWDDIEEALKAKEDKGEQVEEKYYDHG